MILRQRAWYTVDDVRAHPERLYVFGDNLAGWGKVGQACVRDEPNAVGLPTKYRPTRESDAYFTDTVLGDVRFQRRVDDFVHRVVEALEAGQDVVVPADGIGTGLAELPHRAPKVHKFLRDLIAGLKRQYGVRAT